MYSTKNKIDVQENYLESDLQYKLQDIWKTECDTWL